MYGKVLRFIVSLVLLCSAAVLLRSFLVDLGLLDGVQLETLAQSVRGGEVTVEEAVVAFCRGLVNDGPY